MSRLHAAPPGRRAAPWLALLALVSAATAAAEPEAIPLPPEAREALAPLGDGVVGEALPATPITSPAKLRHLEPGTWIYRILAGANRGQDEVVEVERAAPDDPEATWVLATDSGEIQRLRVTTTHEVVKLSQTDLQSDRMVVYRPGLVLEAGMAPGESRTVKTGIATYRDEAREKLEYDGELEYTMRYVGMYRVTVPAGSFDARLLEHHYTMKIGPARARYRSFGFYADGVGNVAEASQESVTAILVYRRSSSSARVLLEAPR